MLFADEIIFIPQKEGGRGGKASALHRYVTVNIILMRVGAEEFVQPALHCGVVHEGLLSLPYFRTVADCINILYYTYFSVIVKALNANCFKFVNYC